MLAINWNNFIIAILYQIISPCSFFSIFDLHPGLSCQLRTQIEDSFSLGWKMKASLLGSGISVLFASFTTLFLFINYLCGVFSVALVFSFWWVRGPLLPGIFFLNPFHWEVLYFLRSFDNHLGHGLPGSCELQLAGIFSLPISPFFVGFL